MKPLLFTLIILPFVLISQAIIAQHTYVRNLGSNLLDERGVDVVITSDNHYLMVGSAKVLDQAIINIFVAKYTFKGELVWRKTLNSTYYEDPRSLVELKDGTGFIIVGVSKELDDANDWLIIRLDTDGNVVWKKFFGGEGGDAPRKVFMLDDGNFLVVGHTFGQLQVVPKNYDGYVLKVSPAGDFLDYYVLPENGGEVINGACLARDGGVVLCGHIKHPTANRNIVYVYKLKPDFNQEFVGKYPFDREARAYCITQLETGEYMIGGYYQWPDDKDPLVMKIDSSGNLLMSRQIWQLRNGTFNSMMQRKDGKIIVVGNSWKHMVTNATSSAGVWVLDTNGVYLKHNVFGSITRHSSANNFRIHNDSLLIIAGYATLRSNYSASTGYYFFENAAIAKTDTGGFHQQIVRSKSGFDFGTVAISQSKEDTLFIINNGYHDRSYNLNLYGQFPTGAFQITEGLALSTDTLASSDTLRVIGKYTPVSATKDSGYFRFLYTFIGSSPGGSNTFLDFSLRGEGVPFANTDDKEGVLKEYRLTQNYPNPFNPSTVIEYQLPNYAKVSLKVYDLLGNEVVSLVDREENAGSHRVVFEGNDLASGMYICQIRADSFTKAIKMLLVK